MTDTRILLPAVALVGLTFLVLVQVPIRRFRAAFAGKGEVSIPMGALWAKLAAAVW